MQVTLIALLAGCNQVYGLDATHLPDGRPSPHCTDDPPQFGGQSVPVDTMGEYTNSYSISLDRRIATGQHLAGIVEGPGDMPLTMLATLMPPLPANNLFSPRLSPEGDELFIRSSSDIYRYHREADRWVGNGVVLQTQGGRDISIVTRRELGPRHMLVTENGNLHEYVETSLDVWEHRAMYTPAMFGTLGFFAPNLTSDGLHVIFDAQTGQGELIYASRGSVDQSFGMPVRFKPVFGVTRVDNPYLLDDCSRLYFLLAPGGVFYIEY